MSRAFSFEAHWRSLVAGLLLGCGPSGAGAPPVAPAIPAAEVASPGSAGPNAAESNAPAPPAPVRVPDDARGGRLFDNWRVEKELTASFVPDSSKTPELDGKGGPNGDGTLRSGSGASLPNTGHDYRLKNLFGWDLRGSSGIYGPLYQNKSYVLPHNLLEDARSPEQLRAWLEQGDQQMPALEQVLDGADIDDLVAYLIKTRQGMLARPDHLFRLEAKAPKNYALLPGGDAARGRERYAQTCANCHGKDGREIPIDDTESLGTMARSSGYEVWFKIVSGQPGTDMDRQVSEATGAAQDLAILDLFAALCDRQRFPALPNGNDVPARDARCGAYLR